MLLTLVLMIFTDFLSVVVMSEIAQILSLYFGGFLVWRDRQVFSQAGWAGLSAHEP